MTKLDEAKKYIGGHWGEIGQKVFDFMWEEGLQPYNTFLDIGCGSLRCGRFFIKYLWRGKYGGIDHHKWLINEGKKVIGLKILLFKKPTFIINENFDFSNIKCKVKYAVAKSVFTHLTKDKIKQCLRNLKKVLRDDGVFYASIFEGDSKNNLKESHDNKKFQYSLDEIKELAEGWNVESLGHRGCKRQTMLMFKLK